MRMRIVPGLLWLLLITGCTNKDEIPSGVLPRDEMGSILWDMVQADQYADIYIKKDSVQTNKKIETLKLYDMVLRMHNVSRDQFKKSFQFYKDRPDLTRPMFDSLIAKGNRQRTEGYNRMSTPPPVAKPPVNTPPNGKPPIHPFNRGAGIPSFPALKDTAKAKGKGVNGLPKTGKGTFPVLKTGNGARNPVTVHPGTSSHD